MQANPNSNSESNLQSSPESPVNEKCRRNIGALTKPELTIFAEITAKKLGVPDNLVGLTFDGKHPKLELDLKKYTHPEIYKKDYRSFLIAGGVGVGKSAFLSAMLKRLICNYCRQYPKVEARIMYQTILGRVHYTHYRAFSTQIREELSPDVLAFDYSGYNLLIIDDMLDGIVKEWDLVKLGELIDIRYGAGLPTWISTNYSAEKLSKWPGFERAYSRLADESWCRYYVVTGKDRRR